MLLKMIIEKYLLPNVPTVYDFTKQCVNDGTEKAEKKII